MINIQFITDFTCPYCYVARASLLKAVSEFDGEVEIKYLPYEGTPVGELQADVYHDPVRRQQYRKYLSKLCRELLPDAKIPPRVVPRPYTRLAFEGRCFAEDGSVLQDGVLDSSLFKEENRPTRTYLGVIDGKYCFLVDIAKDDSDEEKHNYFLVYDSKTNTFSVPWDSDMK